MENLVEATQRLAARGYVGQCRAEAGCIVFLGSEELRVPADKVIVDDVVRLEGTSSPDEESTIYALRAPDGQRRATYCVAHGILQSREDSDVVQRLQLKR